MARARTRAGDTTTSGAGSGVSKHHDMPATADPLLPVGADELDFANAGTPPSQRPPADGTESAAMQVKRKWRDPDSNRGHHDFQSCALPTELSRRGRERLAIP